MTGYWFLTSETMKLFGSTTNKITNNQNSINMSHLKIAEVVLGHCNIVNNDYPQNSSVLYTFKTKQRLKISI